MGQLARLIEYQGEMLPLSHVAKKLEIHPRTLRDRLKVMPIEKALTIGKFKRSGIPIEKGKSRIYEYEGEYYSLRELAKKFNLSESGLRKRLKKASLEDALNNTLPIIAREDTWTPDENDYLCEVYKMPGLYTHWNTHAKRNGWRKRTRDALKCQIAKLREDGLIGMRNKLDESDGWVTPCSLGKCLGVAPNTVTSWLNMGLSGYRNSDDSSVAKIKIHIRHFIDWSVTPSGAEILAKHLHQNRVGLFWFLTQMGNWANAKAPKVDQKYSVENIKKKFERTIDTQ